MGAVKLKDVTSTKTDAPRWNRNPLTSSYSVVTGGQVHVRDSHRLVSANRTTGRTSRQPQVDTPLVEDVAALRQQPQTL
ncbi:hypothetical protein LINPERPRIM_LOCUS2742, partial [Linum perenne]